MGTIKKNLKRYLISSWDTFLAAFLIAFAANIEMIDFVGLFKGEIQDSINFQNLTVRLVDVLYSAYLGAVFSGIRAVLKMAREKVIRKPSA